MTKLQVEVDKAWETILSLFGEPEPDDDKMLELINANKPTTLKDYLMDSDDIEYTMSVTGELRGAKFTKRIDDDIEIIIDAYSGMIYGYNDMQDEKIQTYIPSEVAEGINCIFEQTFEELLY